MRWNRGNHKEKPLCRSRCWFRVPDIVGNENRGEKTRRKKELTNILTGLYLIQYFYPTVQKTQSLSIIPSQTCLRFPQLITSSFRWEGWGWTETICFPHCFPPLPRRLCRNMKRTTLWKGEGWSGGKDLGR